MKRLLLLLLPLILSAQVIDTVIPLFDEPREQLLYISEGNKLYVNLDESYRLLVLDCSTFTVRKFISIPTNYPTAAYGLFNWRRNKIYYGFNIRPESIAVIDNRTDSITKWINFNAYLPYSLCYNSKDNKVYTNNGESLAVIDCVTDSIIKIIGQPYYLSWFVLWDSIGNKVYCGSSWTDIVTVVNCANDSVVAIISSGVSTPCDAVYNPLRRKLYVGGEWGQTGAVICTVGDTLIKNFPLHYDEDIPLIYNSLEDKVYWPHGLGICIIDCTTDSIIKKLEYPDAVWDMCLADWSNRLYFVRRISDSTGYYDILNVLDCSNDSVVSQLRFGKRPKIMTYNPNNQRIYVADWQDSALYVIRDEIPGIEEHQTLDAISLTLEIYPNPVKGVLRVRGPFNDKTFKIFDVSGKLVKDEKVTSAQKSKQEMKISLKEINPGVYFLRLGKETKKFLVIK